MSVTLCNSRTRNLPEVCRQADIVVVAMGKMGAVGADCLRAGQTVVDVGIHVNEEGKLCGDVQFAAAEPVVDAITPRARRRRHRDHLGAGRSCGAGGVQKGRGGVLTF